MGSLERRLRRLEVRAKAAEITEVDRETRAIQEAIRSLSTEDLHSLDKLLSEDLSREETDPYELYELLDEGGRLALDHFAHALAAYEDGTETHAKR